MNPHDLLPEYALGTLEPTEAAEAEALLAHSEAARAEVRTLRDALVMLTEALPPAQLPAGVWDKLQAQLEPSPTVAPPLPPLLRVPRRPFVGSHVAWGLVACLALVAVGELLWVNSSQRAYQQVQRDAYLVADFLSTPETQRISLRGRERQGIGSVLTRPDGNALFVLRELPPKDQSYQAWGHTSDDWEPGSRERLTSLNISDDQIFRVTTRSYAALYLSLEPRGGSPQPTFPLSRIALNEPVATSQLTITAPADGAVVEGERVIVTGVVDANVTNLSYVLNGETRQTTTVGNRFTFTVSLEPGTNTLVVRAEGPDGTATKSLTLTHRP